MNISNDYTTNRYYLNNAQNYIELRNLVIQYPRQCTYMLLAKGRKREGANNWKLKHLYDWIIEMTKMFVEVPSSLLEKIVWILNDMNDYPKCKNINCKNKVRTYYGGKQNYGNHCCRNCSNKDPQTQLTKKLTCLQLYGTTNVFASEYCKNKIKDTCMKKYGVPYSGMADCKKKHTEETCLRKYGVKNINQCPKIKQKGIDTALSKNDHLFNFCKYEFDNRKFDSSWELMYYIYLKDHNIPFEYHKKGLFFTYEKNGKTYRFYLDFVVNGQIQEIKGNQFFNENDEPFNVQFKVWWKEKYDCIIKNKVKILREKDLIYVFEYFNLKYGKNTIKQYLITRNTIKNDNAEV